MRMTPKGFSNCYRFADLTLSTGERRVWRGRKPLEIGKLSFDFLAVLAEAWPNTVTHEELARRVWPRRIVTPENMTQRARMVRQALGDDAKNPRYLGVRHGQGYQLIPEVTRIDVAESWPRWRPRPAFTAAALVVAIAFGSAATWINSGSSMDGSVPDPIARDATPSVERWRAALARNPDSENDLVGLGSLLCRSGELDEGTRLVRRAADLYPMSPRALTVLVHCRIAALDFHEAAALIARGQALGDSFELRTSPPNTGFEQGLVGWHQTFDLGYRSGPNRDFQFSVDNEVARSGRASGRLQASVGTMTTATVSSFIPLELHGRRVRMSAYLKTERIAEEAHLWLRVDSVMKGSLEVAHFENNAYRPLVRGDTDWTRYEMVADVPANAARIVYGFGATGSGIVWMDDLEFEVVDSSVPLTALPNEPPLVLDAPENLDFEHGLEGWTTHPFDSTAAIGADDGIVRLHVNGGSQSSIRQDALARGFQGERVRLRARLRRIADGGPLRAGVRIRSANFAASTRSVANHWVSDGEGWQTYDAVVDVPEDAGKLAYLVIADGNGTVLVDDVTLDIVDESVPLTRPPQ